MTQTPGPPAAVSPPGLTSRPGSRPAAGPSGDGP